MTILVIEDKNRSTWEGVKMKKLFIIISLLLITLNLSSDIVINWPVLPTSDYLRGTAGERLFFHSDDIRKGDIIFRSDFRYYAFKHYWDEWEKEDYTLYSRFINISSVSYSLTSNILLSVRIPVVWLRAKHSEFSNFGLSDIFLSLKFGEISFFGDKVDLYFSTGVKLPTGYTKFRDIYIYDPETDFKYNLGTGSYDFPFIIHSNTDIFGFKLFADIGYIILGNSKLDQYQIIYGDEIFNDLVVLKKLNRNSSVKLEINQYFLSNSSIKGLPYYDYSHDASYKATVSPGYIYSFWEDKFKIEIGFAYDLIGYYTFGGISPIVRIYSCF